MPLPFPVTACRIQPRSKGSVSESSAQRRTWQTYGCNKSSAGEPLAEHISCQAGKKTRRDLPLPRHGARLPTLVSGATNRRTPDTTKLHLY
jgi:hypothetical protein